MLLALATQLSLPTPSNTRIPDVRAIFSYDDVPAYLIQKGNVNLTVYTRTTVTPDGTIQGCVAEVSSGDRKLDAYTCALIAKRAKFRPARWVDGSAAYGVIRVPVRWVVRNGPPSTDDSLRWTVPDVDLSVNHLPKGAHSIVGLSLQVAADENGRPVSCAEWQPSKNDAGKHYPELVSIACQQVTAGLTLSPPVDAAGKPMHSVQTVSVHFQVAH
jgi:hypothetical protein